VAAEVPALLSSPQSSLGDAADAAALAPRRPEIDLAKGVCILGVVLIHSQPLIGTAFHRCVVNRAVPVFLVLFGLTSELWWQARERRGTPLREWYATRLLRLMIPLWGALALWWMAVAVSAAPTPITIWRVLETLVGYLAPLRTGWFVTLILQLVVVFPALRWAVVRIGALPTLVACALIAIVSHTHMDQVIHFMRFVLLDRSTHPHVLDLFYFFWIFAPASFVLVVAGIVLARRPSLLGTRPAVIAAAVFVAGTTATRTLVPDAALTPALVSLLDIPLTIALLGAMASLNARRSAARALAWWGTASWGMYLGQMVLHDGLHLFELRPEEGPIALRWVYCAILLLGATGLVIVGELLRSRAGVLTGSQRPKTPVAAAKSTIATHAPTA
jgi:peptidoglycan/LPS O-acetylase OafA/YrhL